MPRSTNINFNIKLQITLHLQYTYILFKAGGEGGTVTCQEILYNLIVEWLVRALNFKSRKAVIGEVHKSPLSV